MDPNVVNRTKEMLHDLFVHDASVKQELGRAAAALGYGLNPEQYRRPFPGSSTVNNVSVAVQPDKSSPAPTAETPASSSSQARLAKLVGVGLLASVLGIGGTLLATRQPAAPAPVQAKPIELELRWKVVDGKVQQEVVPVPLEPKK